jgi:hypothetical protein
MGATVGETPLTVHGTWSWHATTTTDAAGHETVDDTTARYVATVAQLTSFTFDDDGTASHSVDGVVRSSSQFAEHMDTQDATGLATNGIERERYGYADTSGVCYDHVLASQAGQLTIDRYDSACPGSNGLPLPTLPEAPRPALLAAVGGLVAFLIVLATRRRRQLRTQPVVAEA